MSGIVPVPKRPEDDERHLVSPETFDAAFFPPNEIEPIKSMVWTVDAGDREWLPGCFVARMHEVAVDTVVALRMALGFERLTGADDPLGCLEVRVSPVVPEYANGGVMGGGAVHCSDGRSGIWVGVSHRPSSDDMATAFVQRRGRSQHGPAQPCCMMVYDVVQSVVVHEIAHILTPGAGHDPRWEMVHAKLRSLMGITMDAQQAAVIRHFDGGLRTDQEALASLEHPKASFMRWLVAPDDDVPAPPVGDPIFDVLHQRTVADAIAAGREPPRLPSG